MEPGSVRIKATHPDLAGSEGEAGDELRATVHHFKAQPFDGDGSGLTNLPLTPDTDWTISDSNMYSGVSGNVGIGTSSPAGKLEVSHNGSSQDLVVDSSTGNIGIGIAPNPSYKLFASTSSDATCGRFVNWATSAYSTGVSGLAQ